METLAPPRRRQSAQWRHPQKRERERLWHKKNRTSLDVLARLNWSCFVWPHVPSKNIPIPTCGAQQAWPVSLEVVSGIPYEFIHVVKGSSLFQKFSPSFKSTLQIEGTLQAWDWKLDGLDIGKLPKWRPFRALPIRFARQHRQNSPELTFTSWLGDERRRLEKSTSRKDTTNWIPLPPEKWKSSPSHKVATRAALEPSLVPSMHLKPLEVVGFELAPAPIAKRLHQAQGPVQGQVQ